MLVVISASLLEYFFTPFLVPLPFHLIFVSVVAIAIVIANALSLSLIFSFSFPRYFWLSLFVFLKQSSVILFARYEETTRIVDSISVAFSDAQITAYVSSTVLVSFVLLIYLPVHFKRA